MVDLNRDQTKSLSDFFFDLAKGTIFGGIGISLTIPLQIQVIVILTMIIISYYCVKIGLSLLKD